MMLAAKGEEVRRCVRTRPILAVGAVHAPDWVTGRQVWWSGSGRRRELAEAGRLVGMRVVKLPRWFC
jgi:hypothetical protein